jgi:hypothetical protein
MAEWRLRVINGREPAHMTYSANRSTAETNRLDFHSSPDQPSVRVVGDVPARHAWSRGGEGSWSKFLFYAMLPRCCTDGRALEAAGRSVRFRRPNEPKNSSGFNKSASLGRANGRCGGRTAMK